MIKLKGIFENEVIDQVFQIYCDLDGVLADFNKRFEYFAGMSPSEYETAFGTKKFWELIDEKIGVKFWTGIPWMPDGKILWKFLQPHNPILLSAPSKNETSKIGKRIWVKKNMPGTKLILASRGNKQNYAYKSHILIDDRLDTIEEWRAKGGIGIHHTSASSTISQSKKLGFK
jgi:hypothetical protein